jgi:predicted phosphodiesterase
MASNGRIHLREYEAIKNLLSMNEFKDKTKIALVHHHFMPRLFYNNQPQNGLWKLIEYNSMKLYGRTKILKLLDHYRIKLVLHGHVHDIQDYSHKGIRFLNGGGSMDSQTDDLCINYALLNSNGDIDVKVKRIAEKRPQFDEIPFDEHLIHQIAG